MARHHVALIVALTATAGACGRTRSPRPIRDTSTAHTGYVDSRFRACPGQVALPNQQMSFVADQAPKRIRYTAPAYPKDAPGRDGHGIVILEAGIDRDGVVHQTRVVRSFALFDEAAAAAVCTWRFTPAMLSGHPIAVVETVTVTFPP